VRAFLLAAGLGTRLRPLTDRVPKCMVPIGGQPLLEIWLQSLARADVDQVLVNVHYLPEAVTSYVAGRSGLPEVVTVFEPRLLGSAGTLLANREWAGDDPFLACYADNLTDFDLRLLLDAHQQSGLPATIAAFRTDRPSHCGILGTDSSGVMTSFIEKPLHPESDLANAGLYVFSPEALDLVAGPPPKDIGFDLLPKLVGRARVVRVGGYFRDIGDPDAYQRAQVEWLEKVAW